MNLDALFHITKAEIVNKYNGTKFIFKGLSNVTKDNISSIDDVKYLWIEEAHSITKEVWKRTDPSIRAPDSKIFITFNPHNADDIMYTTFVHNQYPRSVVLKVNWNLNPWFSQSSLHQQRLDYKSYAPDAVYRHVWEGDLMEYNENPIIYPDRFMVYHTLPPITSIILSVDTAYTTKESADYTALGAFARVGKDYYILDIMRGKFEFDILYNKLIEFYNSCTHRFGKVSKVIIENKTAGISLLQLLKKNTRLPLQEYTPTKDKFTRVCEVIEILHSSYHIPATASWLSDYINELTLFTNNGTHEHDDLVDVTTQALFYLRGTLANNSFINILDITLDSNLENTLQN